MHPSRRFALLTLLALVLAACAEAPTPPNASDDPVPAPAGAEATSSSWLIMLYGNADDEILEQDIFTDINEAERVGSSEALTIVAQLDRYKGAFKGDGNWTGARRLLIGADDDLTAIGSEVVEDLGEVNMADGQTLVDFITWAVENYPADRYALILSDHGMGWPGGWNDPAPAGPGPDGLALTADGDLLLLNELDAALEAARSATGITQFDLLGFDACLMGHIEVLAAVAPHTGYVVASQEVEPALGWAYTSFLEQLAADPAMDGAALSAAIVETYIDQDQRIVDDEARSAFAEETFGYGEASAEELAAEMGADITLSAYASAGLPELLAALDDLAMALAELDQAQVAEARTYAQSFENVFSEDGPAPYIDLGHFAELLREIDDPATNAAADALIAAIETTVIAERHGDQRPGASGLSIYFPGSDLYAGEVAGADAYASVADRFAQGALWENFLNFHYFGSALEDAAAPAGAEVLAPGASEISVGELSLSAEEINQGDTTTVSSEVTGEQIGFIYAFTGYYNPDDDTILVADLEYIDAGESREVGGVFYPNWGDTGDVSIEYEWAPVIYGIDDGESVKFALFSPQDYGDTNESVTYSVDGMYRFAEGEERYAQLFFKDAELIKVLGFTGQDALGAPREITPHTGDSFTVLDQLIKLNSDSNADVEYISQPGSTITFGTQNLTLEELTAPAGDYVLGIQAEDLDGNLFEAYATVTVNE